MKFGSIILILIVSYFSSVAQDSCPEFDDLIKQADSLFKQAHQYRKAFFKYNTARTCAPLRRKEVDDKINRLFEEMEAQRILAENNRIVAENNKRDIKTLYDELIDARQKQKDLAERDARNFAYAFTEKNKSLVDTILTETEKQKLLDHVEDLRKDGFGNSANSIAASLKLLDEARRNDEYFVYYLNRNLGATKDKDFFNNSAPIEDIGYIAYDRYYYWALAKTSQALNLLPAVSAEAYGQSIHDFYDSLKVHRKLLEENYWMPDTVIDLPYKSQTLYALPSADNQNFVWGAIGVPEEYKKIQLRFVNLSANDFLLTTDSLVELMPAGKYHNVLATDANYRFMVVKQVDYSLKKNLVEFANKMDANPAVIKLVDRNGRVIKDLYSGAFFFTPDAKFLASWKTDATDLNLYNLKTQTNWKFPFSHPVNTMSFSSDSKTMAYYNDSAKLFCFLDITGNEPKLVSSFSPAIDSINNIDFTGDNKFLKINTNNSIFLYHIEQKKIIFGLDSRFVKNIVVAPNGKEALLVCSRTYNTYLGHFTYRVDMDLRILDRLYSDCNNFFYTPDGRFIVAYDDYDVMKWQTDKNNQVKSDFRTCLGFKELIENGGVPFNYFMTITDASQIEQGARKLYNMSFDTQDTLIGNLYLRQSQLLFDRLKIGDAQNFRQDRVPFFYDWSTYIRRALGNRDFYEQFSTQQAAVGIFDRLMESEEGNYPMLLFYAANANMLLNNLYDSLKAINNNYLVQIKKEISIREKVFAKDPDHKDNNIYFPRAFDRLSMVHDTLGWRYLINNQYQDRLELFRIHEAYLSPKWKVFPDSLRVNSAYIRVLSQLAPSYLYVYANRPKANAKALDSAIYYADKGMTLTTNASDSATFLVIKARAYLLRENGLEKALELYGQVIKDYSQLFVKETMLGQLKRLREAGATTPNISKAEEFLNKK